MKCGASSATSKISAGFGTPLIMKLEKFWHMSLVNIVLVKLKALLEPFGVRHFFTDGWGGYERHINEEQLSIGKKNTQKIERKHLTLRTRIKRLMRKTICFSKSERMHDIVVGLFINVHEFGLAV